MDADRTDAVRALLQETEQAHGTYEATELKGVYDQEWARWYAAYLVDHGLGALLGRQVAVDEVVELLAGGFAEYSSIEPTPSEGWADYLARRMTSASDPS
jgi:hypothetical protein